MNKKMQINREDYIKVNRKVSREEEIRIHGRPVKFGGVHKSKKIYDRKRDKAEMKKALPYFLSVFNYQALFQIGEAGKVLVLFLFR